MNFRIYFFIMFNIFNVTLYSKTYIVPCDSIMRDTPYDSYDRRGNWDAIQPGLFSIIEKIISMDDLDLRKYYKVFSDTTFDGCMPYIFNARIDLDKFNYNDSLMYNWQSDTIVCNNFIYSSRGLHIKMALIFSRQDTIYLSNSTISIIESKKNKKIEPYDITHKYIINTKTANDTLFFDYLKNWNIPFLMRDLNVKVKDFSANYNGIVLNHFMRIIIRNGEPVNVNATIFPVTLNQLKLIDIFNAERLQK